jgi:hypothetical protein
MEMSGSSPNFLHPARRILSPLLPGHYLAAEVINEAQRLKKTKGKKFALTIRWTAGHSNIPGNEEVDKEAKKAAEGHASEAASLPKTLRKPMKISKSAARQKQQERVKGRWIKEWTMSPRYDKLKHIDPSLPSRKFVELISNKKFHRAEASKIFQLRSGHIPLNAYLHRFKLKDSAQCPACGAPRETRQHFLMECPAYAHERWKLKPKKGRSELKYADIVGNGEKVVALAHYIMDTKRFEQDTSAQQKGR